MRRPSIDVFQSTHPQGCDPDSRALLVDATVFQSTHPQGCDMGQILL